MPPVGFEPTIPASARPETYALDRVATGIGYSLTYQLEKALMNKAIKTSNLLGG
jgi:hypothetical protein